MKRTMLVIAGTALAAVLLATAAQAQKRHRGMHGGGPPPFGPPPCADPMPADMQARLLKDFGEKGIDADKDGTLTCDEVKAFFEANPSLRPPRPCGPPPCADPMPADMQTKLLKDFGEKGIDADKDGTLTCDEVKAFFEANPSLRPPRPCGPPPCADPMPADMQTKLLKDFGEKGIDADKDGTLTCDEVKAFFEANPSLRPPRPCGPPPCADPMPADMQAKLLKDFGEKGIDADKNGTLTCDEVKAFFEANPSLRPPRPCGPPPCADPMPTEIQAKLLKDFGEKGIDADKDGTLTCDEVKAFFEANPSLRPPRPCGPPPCADPMPTEIQAKLLKDFGEKGIDADKDGTLTCDEVKAFFEANPPPKPPRGGPPRGGQKGAPGEPEPPPDALGAPNP